jgi:hypothetical protein
MRVWFRSKSEDPVETCKRSTQVRHLVSNRWREVNRAPPVSLSFN